jgi:NADH-quinone oxidoreductase subunit G
VSAPVVVKIDGRELSVPTGTLLVEAAKQAGIEIPVFCHHEKLKPVGACRMCVVEVERVPRLQTACTTPVAKDMVVRTDTKAVIEAREAVLEMLLVNHPLDCPICDKGGECPLQDNTFRHGAGVSRRTEPKRANAKALPLSELIVLDRERCILCYRCTRFHDEIAGDGALVPLERGGTSEIGVLPGTTYDSPFSGNTVELCPVGALTSRQYRFRARPWELETTPSVCCGCSVGCNVRVDARHGSVLRVMGRTNNAIDDGWLCDRGRYGSLPLPLGAEFASPDPAARRPRWPLQRINGQLQRVPFDRALVRAAELLRRPKAAVALSPSLTNEAMQLAGRELRAVFANAAIGFAEPVVSPWPVTGKIRDLAACRRVLDLGCDPWHELPVLALWLRKASAAGAALVAIGPRNGLARDSKHWLKVAPAAMADAAAELLRALAGKDAPPAVKAAAASLRADGPAAVLLGASFVHDARLTALARQLAQALGADGPGGFAGAPMRGANARGAAELAGTIAATDPLAGRPEVLLSFGCEPALLVPGGASIVATSGAVPMDPCVDVVLPLAHPCEADGHFTNLEGTVQRLERTLRRPADVSTDCDLLSALIAAARSGQRVHA